MLVDAIVLTGGRSSRLDAVSKSELVFAQETLLQRTLAAVRAARRIVVVGPDPVEPLPAGILSAREDPPFGGPAAGIAAGMASLTSSSTTTSDATLVLACDMPHVDRVIPRLLRGLIDNPESDGVIAVDDGERLQPLAAGYRTSRLASVIAAVGGAGPLDALSVFRLIDGLNLVPIDVPIGATADVDTWDDAHRLGVSIPRPPKNDQGRHHE